MSNLAEFRRNPFVQSEYALATGRTVENLLNRSESMNGNTKFSTFLQATWTTTSPIDWLSEDDALSASIAGLRSAAEMIASLEDSVDMPYPEILKKFERRHSTSDLEKIFDCAVGKDWAAATKGDIKPLLLEFDWWCSYLDELDLDIQLGSATQLLESLNGTMFKQFRRLADLAQAGAANWDLDAPIFENIANGWSEHSKDFIAEWLTHANYESYYNAKTLREYKSLYTWMFLSINAEIYGYDSHMWATQKQWAAMGYELKPNANATPVFHYFKLGSEDELDSENATFESTFGRKVSLVYNADEVIGYTGKSFEDTKVQELPVLVSRIQELTQAPENMLVIQHTHNGEACFHYHDDYIEVPRKELFRGKDSTKAYYATLLHELVHWTGHETRLNRTFGQFGDADYAFEELVAEIGSAFLCARFGLVKSVRPNSLAYIKSWLGGLNAKNTIKTLEKTAYLANKASNYIYYPKRYDRNC